MNKESLCANCGYPEKAHPNEVKGKYCTKFKPQNHSPVKNNRSVQDTEPEENTSKPSALLPSGSDEE